MDKRIKLYLASPWFNEEQDEREKRVKNRLRELGFEVFSPREEVTLTSNASEFDQQEAFEKDVNGIIDSDAVFAITNGKDMGTIWECGFACGFSYLSSDTQKIPVIYFAENLNGPFNLMLARSGILTYTNLNDVTYKEIEEALKSGYGRSYKGEIE